MNYEILTVADNRVNLRMMMDAVDIVETAMGDGYFKSQLGPNNKSWIAVTAEYEEAPKVIAYASITKQENECVLRCSAVHPDYRGRGIGTQLVKTRLEHLKAEGCDTVKSYAWILNGECPAEKTLLANGFYALMDAEGFYDGSIPCIVCGDGCFCTARIFEKKL